MEFAGQLAGVCLIGGAGLLWYQWRQGHTFDSLALNMATLGYTAVGLLGTGLVLLALRYRGSGAVYARTLRSPFLRSFGKYSYAMYIVHLPVAEYSGRLVNHFWGNTLVGLAGNWVLGIGVTYGLAVLSWKYFEAPILSLKDRIAGYRTEAHFENVVEAAAVTTAKVKVS